ncbi:hypothetical protein VZC37_12425 [Gordonia sp. LSe1-13]|uniref:SCO6045-like C-terminal domain-containing protein n=1 Tax=Gordonia sesuvii TaxID=3116777 RepID=A0ABU7MDG8_9ACTN|nr:hypothetical protein [Gordonia sp. LSe1-13]
MTDNLARRQAALVRALVDGGDPPAGFDPGAVAAAAEVLRRKRSARTGATTPDSEQAPTARPRRRWWQWSPNAVRSGDRGSVRETRVVDGPHEPNRPA